MWNSLHWQGELLDQKLFPSKPDRHCYCGIAAADENILENTLQRAKVVIQGVHRHLDDLGTLIILDQNTVDEEWLQARLRFMENASDAEIAAMDFYPIYMDLDNASDAMVFHPDFEESESDESFINDFEETERHTWPADEEEEQAEEAEEVKR